MHYENKKTYVIKRKIYEHETILKFTEDDMQIFFFKSSLPAKANATWSSNKAIFLTVLSSCSLATAFFSTPRTTMFFPRTPTCNNNISTGVVSHKKRNDKLYERYFSNQPCRKMQQIPGQSEKKKVKKSSEKFHNKKKTS